MCSIIILWRKRTHRKNIVIFNNNNNILTFDRVRVSRFIQDSLKWGIINTGSRVNNEQEQPQWSCFSTSKRFFSDRMLQLKLYTLCINLCSNGESWYTYVRLGYRWRLLFNKAAYGLLDFGWIEKKQNVRLW